MRNQLPLLANLCRRLRADLELAVASFDRYHRYASGQDLRTQAKRLAVLVDRAWHRPQERLAWVEQLVDAVDDFKLDMQLAADVKAFASIKQFEALQLQVEQLGMQCGGWHRDLKNHPKGQNPAPRAAPERAKILSTRDAPQGAKR